MNLGHTKGIEPVDSVIRVVFSLGGNYEYRAYFESLLEKIDSYDVDFTIEPTYAQTDTEAILKVIYSQGRDDAYDLLLISPQHLNSLIEQNLITNLDDFILRKIGYEVLDDYLPKALENSLQEGRIWNLPMVRSVDVLVMPNAHEITYNLEDLLESTNVYVPVNRIIKDMMLSMVESDHQEQFVLDDTTTKMIQILKEGHDSRKILNYSEQIHDNNQLVAQDTRGSYVIKSIALETMESLANGTHSLSGIQVFSGQNFPTSSVNLFVINKEEMSPFLVDSLETFVEISLQEDPSYHLPLTKNQLNVAQYQYQRADYDGYQRTPFSKLSIVETEIVTSTINLLNRDVDIEMQLEEISLRIRELLE